MRVYSWLMERRASAMWWRGAVLGLALAVVPLDAMAMDGYQDRRGLFGGFQLGGAAWMANETTGAMLMGGTVGGAPVQWLTIAGTFDLFWLPSGTVDATLFRPSVAVRGFFTESGFGEAKAGIAWNLDAETAGFAAGAGVGYEFFVNSNLAVGTTLGYERQIMPDGEDANVIQLHLGFLWY